jgi:lipid-A-disaccharide synthase
LYYVSPQVWAWRRGRVKKIASLVDRMAVVLPFEEKIYRNAGLECEFVGHPILDEIETVLGPEGPSTLPRGRRDFKSALGFGPDRQLLAILPGSRPSELKRHLPLMVDVVREIRSDEGIDSNRQLQICMPLAPNTDEESYGSYLETLKQEGVTVKKGEALKVLAASDMALVASGTATLQTAFLEVPMVVVYKLSPLTYHLGKHIIRVKHISLVNILSGREVVAELIQHRANPEEIINELRKIMTDGNYREDMLQSYRRVKEPFTGKWASDRVAEIITEMVGKVGNS